MRPIFVLGCPRSGTTIVGESLQRHPQVCGGTETHFFIPALQGFDEIWRYSVERLPSELNWLEAEGITKDQFLLLYTSGLRELVEHRATRERWLDHTGGNVLVWDKLRKVFPDAQFLFVIRDGRNVVESVMHAFWGGSFSFQKAAQMWVEHASAGIAALADASPSQGRLVRYESLVAQPKEHIEQILDFLGLPWSDDVVTPFTDEPLLNSSFPEDTSADKLLPRWRSWEPWKRREFAAIANGTLAHFGYEPDGIWTQ